MSNKLLKSVSVEQHKRIKNKTVTITTIAKANKTKMNTKEIKMVAEGILNKSKSGSKIMIKVLSNLGYFQIKGYDDSLDMILSEEDYLNSRNGAEPYTIYKASFYIMN